MEIKQRRAIFKELQENMYGAGAFLEVTEWSNGEGFDVTLEVHHRTEKISLTYDVVDIMLELILHLKNNY